MTTPTVPTILSKGQAPVVIKKSAIITARASWASATDYDLYALVLKTDGSVETVATFGAKNVPARNSVLDGAVRHLGDVGREAGGQAQETIEIRMTPDILAVVPVAYSAQSNGTGSFYRYKVSLEIDNGAGDRVQISSQNANNDDTIYTCAIGIIENTEAGVRITPLEEYSRRGSEDRPTVELTRSGLLRKGPAEIKVNMDRGPKNNYK